MSGQSPNIFVADIGVVTNASLPLFKVPTGYGGITIIEAQATFLTAGTAGLHLVDMGTAGTAVAAAGTLAAGTASGGTAFAAKTPGAFTINTTTDGYLSEGHYLGVKEDNTGTTVTVTEIAITYKWGK